MSSIEELKFDADGLIPVVVQDAASGEVLTLAYMNAESLAQTRALNETVFYSRSRKMLWHKGETSGHYQTVTGMVADCDKDALVVRVKPLGPACHTGAISCFHESLDGFDTLEEPGIGLILAELEKLIAERKTAQPEGSYTAKLFGKGLKRILQKVGEEATETVIAGLAGDRNEMIRETADLLFHVLVALAAMDISLQDIAAELRNRRK